MKIAFCGYDYFSAALRNLLEDGHDVYRVYTVPCDNQIDFNQYIYDICQQYKLPVSEERVDEKIIQQLQNEGCEVLITAAYFYKIPDLSATAIKGINIHPTLLPEGRGPMPLPWIILKNLTNSGVSIHKLTQDFDAGDILQQQSFPVTDNENLESLSAKIQIMAKAALLEVIRDFDHFWQHAQPQGDGASFWPRADKEQRRLDWHKPVKELDRICRAFGKTGCLAHFDKQNWLVGDLTGWQQAHEYKIGEVVHKTNTEIIVASVDGLVSLRYFEPAG